MSPVVPDDDVDSLFDSILAAKNLDASLRTIPSGTLVQLASYSHAYYQKEAANASAEIEAELQVRTTAGFSAKNWLI